LKHFGAGTFHFACQLQHLGAGTFRICLQHFGAGIFYLACELKVVVGRWVLSVGCGFLFVLLFLLQLKLL
jgi:hypothetical protein